MKSKNVKIAFQILTNVVCSIAAAPQFDGQSPLVSGYVNKNGQLVTVYHYTDSNGQEVLKEVISEDQPEPQPIQPQFIQSQPVQPQYQQPNKSPSPTQSIVFPNPIPVPVPTNRPSAVNTGAYIHDNSGAYKPDNSGQYRGK